MRILHQNKKRVKIEVSPEELLLIKQALIKERNLRGRTWKNLEAKYPEELLYHAFMQDSCKRMVGVVSKGIEQFKNWGILK
jgi:hypothetical protein